MHDPLDPDPSTAPFSATHVAVRTDIRRWIATHVAPHVDEWEAQREFPRDLFVSAGAAGVFGHKYPPADGGCGPDPIADVVVTEELARCGSAGVAAAIGATKDLAPYYVARFGTPEQRARWLHPTIRGEAVAGLAVTEPGAGSDVAALTTRATADGDGWVIDGAKTFCTNGSWADWILVAARTSDAGAHGVSLYVVPTGSAGFSATRIPTLGWRTSHTGALTFDRVRVSADALLGEVDGGFRLIMASFQWERLGMALAAVSAAAANLAAARPHLSAAGVSTRAEWLALVRGLTAVRALTYDALQRHLAGAEPLHDVSAAKWRACDLDLETADLRLRLAPAATPQARTAERALRDARLGPIGGGAREVMAELVARTLGL
ncbi:MAG TPA: acyl-CoA dehydrogenase family protein [Gemmatimonadaceae bacterium]|nr:acyl-CoA dehydrogenase family protein [Gemmatimonadaceae bacterium]